MPKQSVVFTPAALPQSLVSETIDTFSGHHQQAKKWRHLADSYFDAGVTVAMLASDKGEDKRERNAMLVDLQNLAVLALHPEDQALYSKPKDALKGALQKTARRLIDKDVERCVRSLLTHLAASEKAGEKRPPRAPMTLHEKLDDLFVAALRTIQRDDGRNGAPIEKLAAVIKFARAEVNALFKK